MARVSALMVVVAVGFVEFAEVQEFCKFVEVKHRVVFAVFAKEGDVLAEVHILEVISDKAAVATLNSLAKMFDGVVLGRHLFDDTSFRRFDKIGQQSDLGAALDLGADLFDGLRGI